MLVLDICVYYSILYWKTESLLIFESMLACSLLPGLHPILLYQFCAVLVLFLHRLFEYICIYTGTCSISNTTVWIFNKRHNRFKLGELSLSLVEIHHLKTNVVDRCHKAAHQRMKLHQLNWIFFILLKLHGKIKMGGTSIPIASC